MAFPSFGTSPVGDNGVYKVGTFGGNVTAAGAHKEDLLDQIVMIDPFDTPWVSQAPKTTCKHVYHQWLLDTLGDVPLSNAAYAVEGAEWSANAAGYLTVPTREFNVTSILREDIAATETMRAVDAAGFADVYAYEMQKATKRLAILLEKMVLQNVATATTTSTGASNAARRMKSLQDFITTNKAFAGANSQGKIGGGSPQIGTTGVAGQLTSGDFNDMLEAIYKTGGNPEQVYVSPKVKRQISAFTLIGSDSASPYTRNIAAIDKKLISSIDFYDTDFGIIQIVLDRWVPEATNTATSTATATDVSGVAFFLQRSMNRLAWLRPMQHQFMGKRGDSVAGSIIGEVTLECLNQKANGIIKSINNKSAVT
jgi:hypothetical protein